MDAISPNITDLTQVLSFVPRFVASFLGAAIPEGLWVLLKEPLTGRNPHTSAM